MEFNSFILAPSCKIKNCISVKMYFVNLFYFNYLKTSLTFTKTSSRSRAFVQGKSHVGFIVYYYCYYLVLLGWCSWAPQRNPFSRYFLNNFELPALYLSVVYLWLCTFLIAAALVWPPLCIFNFIHTYTKYCESIVVIRIMHFRY